MAPVVVRLDSAPVPIEAVSRFTDLPHLCLLESAAPSHPLSRYSYLTADPVTMVAAQAGGWPAAREQLRRTFAPDAKIIPGLPPFQGGWIGWFSYELGAAFDEVEPHAIRPQPVPDLALGLHDWVMAWDHRHGDCWLISSGADGTGAGHAQRAQARANEVLARLRRAPAPRASSGGSGSGSGAVAADFTAAGYAGAVQRVIDYVLAGDIFQANLAQRFVLPFAGSPRSLYQALTKRSPAPMAAYIEHANVAIVSASPEQFLRFDAASGSVETRPIKGTRPRDGDGRRDAALAAELWASEKDRAENVMIVDLLRNDLSRVCRAGSVHAPVLCALETHPTVHHLVSTVIGTLAPGRDALDLLAATFPGGSITGAPKLRAMEIIRELEPVGRGVYAGAIGWIGFDGAMELSIAIRTITVSAGVASLHAGGGITARSVPQDEYRETLDKAGALLESTRMSE